MNFMLRGSTPLVIPERPKLDLLRGILKENGGGKKSACLDTEVGMFPLDVCFELGKAPKVLPLPMFNTISQPLKGAFSRLMLQRVRRVIAAGAALYRLGST